MIRKALFLCILLSVLCMASHAAAENTTLMVYMCGSNLESRFGSASADMREMIDSAFDGEMLTVLVMAGGSEAAENGSYFLQNSTAIYEIRSGRIRRIWQSPEPMNMGDSQTLTFFLKYGREHRPADHFALILWDHGGGPLEGICYDTVYQQDALSLSELRDALEESAFRDTQKLSWIGFDACLMASLETAVVCQPYAGYMIASQETEPVNGWDYRFLKDLPACSGGADAGRLIIEHYIDPDEIHLRQTLSCVDLSVVPRLNETVGALYSAIDRTLVADTFSEYSIKRQAAKSFGRVTTNSDYDLVDLLHLSLQYADDLPDEAKDIQNALREVIVLQDGNQENACGLSQYSPFYNKERFTDKWEKEYAQLGLSASCVRHLNRFAGIWTGRQLADWSYLQYQGLPYTQQQTSPVELTLTNDQLTHFASAKVVILQETGIDNTYWYIYESDPLTPDGSVLRYDYDYSALYAVDQDGMPLTDAISFEIVEGSYQILLSLDNISRGKQLHDYIFQPQQENDEGALSHMPAILTGRRNTEDPVLDIDSFVLLNTTDPDTKDPADIVSSFTTARQIYRMDTDSWPYLNFSYFRYSREPKRDDAGRILPFSQWPIRNRTQSGLLIASDGRRAEQTPDLLSDPAFWDANEFGVVDQRRPWQLHFQKHPESSGRLYAQFIITDTQNNAVASELIALYDPNKLHEEDIHQQMSISGQPDVEIFLDRIRVINDPDKPGLYCYFSAKNRTDCDLIFMIGTEGDALQINGVSIHAYENSGFPLQTFSLAAGQETSNYIVIPSQFIPAGTDHFIHSIRLTPVITYVKLGLQNEIEIYEEYTGTPLDLEIDIDIGGLNGLGMQQEKENWTSIDGSGTGKTDSLRITLPNNVQDSLITLRIPLPQAGLEKLRQGTVTNVTAYLVSPLEGAPSGYYRLCESFVPDIRWDGEDALCFEYLALLPEIKNTGYPLTSVKELLDGVFSISLPDPIRINCWGDERSDYQLEDMVFKISPSAGEGNALECRYTKKRLYSTHSEAEIQYQHSIAYIEELPGQGCWILQDTGDRESIRLPFDGPAPQFSFMPVDGSTMKICLQFTLDDHQCWSVLIPYSDALSSAEKEIHDTWYCMMCGALSTGENCAECGSDRSQWLCRQCGWINHGEICDECGTSRMNSLLMEAESAICDERYEEAIPYLMMTLYNGDTYSPDWMGFITYHGLGTPVDLIQAYRYFKIGAELGSGFAHMYMGYICIQMGRYDNAVWHFRQSAEKGYAESYMRLGDLYLDDYYQMTDYDLAESYYLKAAELGDTASQYQLGIMYMDPAFGRQDTDKAERFLLLASEQGHADAAFRLGDLYAERDFEKAMHYYQLAIDRGSTASMDACSHMGDLCLNQAPEADADLAETYYLKAVEMGSANAAYSLALLYLTDEYGRQDYDRAEKHLLWATEHGHADAACRLGQMYLDGAHSRIDFEKAASYLQLAVERGAEDSRTACTCLGNLYRMDEYGMTDYDLAEQYYLQGAELGSPDARYALAVMYSDERYQRMDLPKAMQYLEASFPDNQDAYQMLMDLSYPGWAFRSENPWQPLILDPPKGIDKEHIFRIPDTPLSDYMDRAKRVTVYLLGVIEGETACFRYYQDVSARISTEQVAIIWSHPGSLLAPEDAQYPLSIVRSLSVDNEEKVRLLQVQPITVASPPQRGTLQIRHTEIRQLMVYVNAQTAEAFLYGGDKTVSYRNSEKSRCVSFSNSVIRFSKTQDGLYHDAEILSGENSGITACSVPYQDDVPVFRFYPAEQFHPLIAFMLELSDSRTVTLIVPYEDLIS